MARRPTPKLNEQLQRGALRCDGLFGHCPNTAQVFHVDQVLCARCRQAADVEQEFRSLKFDLAKRRATRRVARPYERTTHR